MPGIDMTGEVSSMARAGERIIAAPPAIILADATIDGESTVPLLMHLRHTCCSMSRIVFLASEIDPTETDALAEIRVAGYLLWSDLTRTTLPHCLTLALTSDITVISPAVARALGEALRNMSPEPVTLPNMPESCPIVKFTARYREILLLVEAGLTNPAIADRLSISEHTVHTHLAEIYRRLHVGNRILAANVARQCGYLD